MSDFGKRVRCVIRIGVFVHGKDEGEKCLVMCCRELSER